MSRNCKTKLRLSRALAFSLAIVFVMFIAQALGHSHAKGQTEAACHVCQAAHLGSAPAGGSELLSSPLSAAGYLQPFIVTIHQELFGYDSPSRAPPTA
ncbi:MAG: hypothetical protein M3P45_13180 [Acidobacteriota bacterium]|nr:hypothetical protein [Acidobacteriota bacterium]